MRSVVSTIVVFIIVSFSVVAQSFPVHLNSIGFLPEYKKRLLLPTNVKPLNVVNAENGKEVFFGKTTGPLFQKDVDQNVWTADFSALKTPGKYFLEVPGLGKSTEFEIAGDIFRFATKTSYRAFYLWCYGMAVKGEYDGNIYETEACHLNDGYEDYLGKPGTQRDGTGGWYDAGDHGKYIVNAGVTVGVLFYAWDHFQENLEKIDYELPETAPGFPEFLNELKWETDWILKLQYPVGSGRVSHKLMRTSFSRFIMPQDDHEKRYFAEWSSAATADFVAMMAMAARYFKPYDAAYSQKCLDAAWVSYRFLQENPKHKRFKQGDFRTGGYQSNDLDDRLWAVAELWETTSDLHCLADFEKHAAEMDFEIDENWDWSDVSNLGMFIYALSKREGKNPEIAKNIRQNIIENADAIVKKAQEDVYYRPLAGRQWHRFPPGREPAGGQQTSAQQSLC